MVKNEIVFYTIWTSYDDKGNGRDNEAFDSYDEAFANRMNYADWYRPNGCVSIKRYVVSKNIKVTDTWFINQYGEIEAHYNH